MNIKKNLYKIAFTLISLFIFVYSLYDMYYRAERIYWAFACVIVIPLLIIIGILLITLLTEKKFPKATVIISSLLCSFILFIQLLFSIFIVEFSGIAQITDVNKYEKALKLTYRDDYIEHFPKHIPPHARNVQLFKSADNIFGSESIYLRFDTDRDFIESELSKYKYEKEFRPKDNIEIQDPLFFYSACDECKYHIIHQISSISNIYGIAEKENTIIYFYLNP